MLEARFLVESPYQALCAAEARHHLGLTSEVSELVVLPPSEDLARVQVDRAVAVGSWSRQRVLAPRGSPASHVRRALAARRLARVAEGAQRTFIGDYRSPLMRHVANRVEGELYLLDDGLGTLWVNDERRGLSRSGEIVLRSPVHQLKRIPAAVFGLDTRPPRNIHFFSVYDLKLADGDELTTHDFAWLRQQFPAGQVGDGTLFVGSSMVEFGAITRRDYLSLVSRSLERLAGPVTYVPHRREHSKTLHSLEDLGLSIEVWNGPLELEILERGPIPRQVVAFFSTTLHTLSRLVSSEVALAALRVPEALVHRRWRSRLASYYGSLAHVTRGRARVIDV